MRKKRGSEVSKATFMEHVNVKADTGCWEWKWGKQRDGYGCLRVNGKMMLAHRVSYEIHVGPIPEGLCACHKCDNRICLNPDHLFLGTNYDNVLDSIAKGRAIGLIGSGEDSPYAKLTEWDVHAIREWRRLGAIYKHIGALFGVSKEAIRGIISGRTWKHVPVLDFYAQS